MVLAAWATSVSAAAEKPGETKPLDPPEKELAQILSGLDALEKKIDAYSRLGRKKNASLKELTARYYLETGLEFFERGDYLTATRFLVRYREKTQSPDLGDLLKADYATARSYERLGYAHKAVETYLNYLSNFLTAKDKDYTRLLDVVEAVIPLAADTDRGRRKLEEITASLLSLDYPGRLEPDLYYHAAKAALNTGSLRRASRWLAKADSLLDAAERFELKARTRYLASLVDTREENYDEAEETLTWIIQNAKEGNEEIRDLSRLAVARIAVHRRQPARAIRYYEAIPKNSPETKTALFESVYVHLEAGHPKKARQNALTFLARFPEAADAYQLRSLLAYLDLRAGALDTASVGLQSSHKNLKKIEKKLIQDLAGSERLHHEKLTALLETTGGQVAAAPPIEESHELFGRLAELKRRLGDIRGEIRDTIFTAGKLSMDRLKPQWKRRSEQLDQLTKKLLNWGHRLAATERETYREALSRQDEAMLKASADRRTSLLSGAAEWMRQKKGWRAYSRFLNETETVGNLAARLGRIRASLATARYLTGKDSSGGPDATRLKTL